MRFNFYKKLFILLFKTKLIFKRPNKKKILFFDASHSKLIIDKFKMNYKNYEILNSRFETLNIPILIQTIKKEPFNLSLKNYFLQYISAVKPEKVITLIDNNITFYQFKKYFPDIEFFSIQCGHRTKNRDFFLQLKKKDFKKQDLSCDRVFVANLGFGKKMQKYINCKITPLGFFKNNFIKISNNKIQKKTILFISQFREYQINADSFKKKHFFVEKKILPVIQKYCKDKNFLFYILGCSKNSKLEEKYFQSILKPSNFIFKKKLEYPKNYKFIDKFEVVTFIDSTLGYEAISRKKKVAVFSKRKLSKKSPIEKFGWPVRYPNKGLFYSNRSFNLEDTYRILNNVTKISQKNWNKKILPSMKELAIFNYKNSILKNKIN
jgi:surface carbohydrate biosynthesis protein